MPSKNGESVLPFGGNAVRLELFCFWIAAANATATMKVREIVTSARLGFNLSSQIMIISVGFLTSFVSECTTLAREGRLGFIDRNRFKQ